MSNISERQKTWHLHPYFSPMSFQDTEDFNIYNILFVFQVISIFFTYKKSKFSCPGLQMNSHTNFTYSFPQLKIILIPTMIRSNRISFILLLSAQAPPFQRYYCYVT